MSPVLPGLTRKPLIDSPGFPAAVAPRYVISEPASTLNESKVASIVRVARAFRRFVPPWRN